MRHPVRVLTSLALLLAPVAAHAQVTSGPGVTSPNGRRGLGQLLSSDIPSTAFSLVQVGFQTSDGAPWVRGTSTGPRATQDATGAWWQVKLSGASVPAAWFGFSDANTDAQNAAALNLAIAAAKGLAGGDVTRSVVVDIPTGRFPLAGRYVIGRDGLSVGVRGAGKYATVLLMTSTVPDLPTWDFDFADPAASVAGASTAAQVVFENVGVVDYVAGNNVRTARSSTIRFADAARVSFKNVLVQNVGGQGVIFDAVNAIEADNDQVEAVNNTALVIRSSNPASGPSSGNIANSRFRVQGIGGAGAMQGPAVRVSGAVSGLTWISSRIGGAGPRVIEPNQSVAQSGSNLLAVIGNANQTGARIASINASGGAVTVTTTFAHTFAVGDVVGLYNVGPAATYYQFFTVTAVGDNVPNIGNLNFTATPNKTALGGSPPAATLTGTSVVALQPFNAGNDFIIQGAAPAAYNRRYTVVGMDDIQTVRLALPADGSATGLGNATAPGSGSSYYAQLLIDNEFGPVNESTFTGGIIEAVNAPIDKGLDGSYAEVVDGTRSNTGNIYADHLAISELDGGHRNVAVFGNVLSGGTRTPSVLHLSPARADAPGGNFVLSGPMSSVTIDPFISIPQTGFDAVAFASASTVRMTATAKGGPLGVTLNGGHFSEPLAGGSSFGPGYPYGIVFDGDGTNLVSVDGAILAGTAAPVTWINGAYPEDQELAFGGGTLLVPGPWPTDFAGDLTPTVAQSGAAVALPMWLKTFKLAPASGRSLTTIASGSAWKGRTGSFVVTRNALTTATGGNIATAATWAVGSLVQFSFVGSGSSGRYYLK